ncbi:MAG TPA: bifunctional 5,10-methylenetetrahydrofolate dehydrogenase/5,10-methenyltetrahydrofolate cyclohydrolase [Planctomycetota bacterium]|nr:bifunctional 5,10-methylenetetrahydrofolate dehydrogenase/5,10-methenyltetrahydrofolate cyclohydrolase [Planctomycetota bacterium]
MTATILSGDPIAQAVTAEAKAALPSLKTKPRVAAIHNEKSAPVRAYMKRQRSACEGVGIPYDLHPIGDMSEADAAALISRLAADPAITGITIHQPMPAGFNEERLLQLVPAKKDVEATHPENLGRLELGVPGPRPVAAEAAVEILRAHKPDCRGLDAVVIGRSSMVGKPAALLLLAWGGKAPTVTVCHSGTADLAAHVRRADVVIAAAGRAGTVRGDMLKPGAIVLDIGINRNAEGKIVGDVDFDSAKEVASAITPVPGGVGPVAVALFLRNVLSCARLA